MNKRKLFKFDINSAISNPELVVIGENGKTGIFTEFVVLATEPFYPVIGRRYTGENEIYPLSGRPAIGEDAALYIADRISDVYLVYRRILDKGATKMPDRTLREDVGYFISEEAAKEYCTEGGVYLREDYPYLEDNMDILTYVNISEIN